MFSNTTTDQHHRDEAFQAFLKLLSKVAGRALSFEHNSFEIDGVTVSVRLHDWPAFHCVSMTFQLNACEVQGEATLSELLSSNRDLVGLNPLPSVYALSPCRKHVQFIQRFQPAQLPLRAIENYVIDTVRQLQHAFMPLLIPR